jgi:hypothetical protein
MDLLLQIKIVGVDHLPFVVPFLPQVAEDLRIEDHPEIGDHQEIEGPQEIEGFLEIEDHRIEAFEDHLVGAGAAVGEMEEVEAAVVVGGVVDEEVEGAGSATTHLTIIVVLRKEGALGIDPCRKGILHVDLFHQLVTAFLLAEEILATAIWGILGITP